MEVLPTGILLQRPLGSPHPSICQLGARWYKATQRQKAHPEGSGLKTRKWWQFYFWNWEWDDDEDEDDDDDDDEEEEEDDEDEDEDDDEDDDDDDDDEEEEEDDEDDDDDDDDDDDEYDEDEDEDEEDDDDDDDDDDDLSAVKGTGFSPQRSDSSHCRSVFLRCCWRPPDKAIVSSLHRSQKTSSGFPTAGFQDVQTCPDWMVFVVYI